MKVNRKQNIEIVEFLKVLREKNTDCEFSTEIFSTEILIFETLKLGLCFKDFLTHPLILTKKEIFEKRELLKDKKTIKERLKKVIEFELNESEKTELDSDKLQKVIKAYNNI